MKKTIWVILVLLFLIVLSPFFLIAMLVVLSPWPMTEALAYWTPLALAGTLLFTVWYYNTYHKSKEDGFGDWP